MGKAVFQHILLGILFYPSDNIATTDQMTPACTTNRFNGHLQL